MSYFILSALINMLGSAFLGLFVYVKDRKDPVNLSFSLYSLSLTCWSFSYFIWQISTDESQALLWAKFLMAGAILIPIAYIRFVYAVTKQKENKPFFIALGVITLLLLIANTGNLLVDRVESRSIFSFWPVAGTLYPAYLLIWFPIVIYAMVLLFQAYQKAKGRQKTLFGLILLGNIIGYAGGATNYPLWFNFHILPWGNILVSFYSLMIAYAIIAHQLFDIRVIFKRTIIYSGLLVFALGTYSMVIFAATSFLGGSSNAFDAKTFITNIVAAGLIAVGYEPLRRFLQEKTDSFLFKKEYEEQTVLRDLAKKLNNVVALDEALEIMMHTIVKVLHLKHAVTFVFQKGDNGKPAVKRIKQIGYASMSQLYLNEQDFTIQYFTAHPGILHVEEFEQQLAAEKRKFNYVQKKDTKQLPPETSDLIRQHAIKQAVVKKIKSLDASLAIPLHLGDQPLGLILLSGRLSGDSFSRDDIDLLETLGAQAISSIQKAKLYEGDQMKSEFVSIASHELLTPISAMEGYLSMILDENIGHVDEQAKEYLTKVYTSSKRLSVLIKDLLSVSRLESGSMKIDRQSLDIAKAITDSIDQLKFMAKEKGLSLTFAKPTEPLPPVLADPDRTTQVLINLISNAIKYTPSGSVTVKAYTVSKPTNHIQVDVIDTGLGMTKAAQTHLFERFYRVSTPETTGIIGTGLGLYITKSIMERMEGSVWVESEPGKGSTFSITLPLFKVERSKEEKLAKKPTPNLA